MKASFTQDVLIFLNFSFKKYSSTFLQPIIQRLAGSSQSGVFTGHIILAVTSFTQHSWKITVWMNGTKCKSLKWLQSLSLSTQAYVFNDIYINLSTRFFF
jgi:hypothetical protein